MPAIKAPVIQNKPEGPTIPERPVASDLVAASYWRYDVRGGESIRSEEVTALNAFIDAIHLQVALNHHPEVLQERFDNMLEASGIRKEMEELREENKQLKAALERVNRETEDTG